MFYIRTFSILHWSDQQFTEKGRKPIYLLQLLIILIEYILFSDVNIPFNIECMFCENIKRYNISYKSKWNKDCTKHIICNYSKSYNKCFTFAIRKTYNLTYYLVYNCH